MSSLKSGNDDSGAGKGKRRPPSSYAPKILKNLKVRRTCPVCGHEAGARLGTGSKGAKPCPGTLPDGKRCTHMWSGGRKTQELKELAAACETKLEAPFADVELAFDKAMRAVHREAAKVGGSAVLVWVNGVSDPKDKQVEAAVKKTPDPSDKQVHHHLMPEGTYAHVGTSRPYKNSKGNEERASACGVLLQRTSGTQLCSSLLDAVAPAMHAITAQHLLGRASEKAAAAQKAALVDGGQADAAGPSTREAPQGVAADLEVFLKDLEVHEASLSSLAEAGCGTLKRLQSAVDAAADCPSFMTYAEHLGLSKTDAFIIYQKLTIPNNKS